MLIKDFIPLSWGCGETAEVRVNSRMLNDLLLLGEIMLLSIVFLLKLLSWLHLQ